ncbi:MAG: hypothetical protein Q9159_002650 [Coniocarpon cinnabarinum]
MTLAITQILVGVMIGQWGLFNPFLIAGGIASTVASGLMFTLTSDSAAKVWIGYQILAGVALGLCFNVPVIITQKIVHKEDIAPATAIMLCKDVALVLNEAGGRTDNSAIVFQSLGGSLLVTAAQSLFQNGLMQKLEQSIPSINPSEVFLTGSTRVQTSFPPRVLPAIDSAYMTGLHKAFILAIASGGVATLVTVSQRWFRLDAIKNDSV